jgi:hypothetical protein
MNLLVTASHPTTLWKLDGSEIEQLEFRDLTYYKLSPENDTAIPDVLPPELGEIVIKYLFWEYIYQRSFDQALDLLCLNHHYARLLYTQVYCKHNLCPVDYYKRVSATLRFCEGVDDYLLAPKVGGLNACLRSARPGYAYNIPPLRPWQFGRYNNLEPMTAGFFRGPDQIHHFATGPLVGDIVWVNGKFKKGVLVSKELYHPVINLILCDTSDNVLPTIKSLEKNFCFKRFVEILTFIYGPYTLVNFMIKEDENPFIVLTDAFISI